MPLIISGVKTTTWRLFDDKDLQLGDELVFVDKSNDQEFAKAMITAIREKTLGEIDDHDLSEHDTFTSRERMLADYHSYYGDRLSDDTIVKMISFRLK